MILARSGRLTMIVVEHSTQPRAALDGCSAISDKLFLDDEPIVQTLVVALPVIMLHEFLDGLPQGSFSAQDDPLEARFLDGSDEAFRIGIQVRRARWQFQRLHAAALQNLQEFRSEQRVAVMDQVSLPGQKAFLRVTEVPGHLADPQPVRLPGDSTDLHPPTRQVDEEKHQESGQPLARPGLDATQPANFGTPFLTTGSGSQAVGKTVTSEGVQRVTRS